MPNIKTAQSRIVVALFWYILACVVFALAYTQAGLFYSNQHQYFLHGLAQANYGILSEDWLANTKDPTPAFTQLVALTYEYLHPWCYYGFYALLMGAYFVALVGLIDGLSKQSISLGLRLTLATLLLLIHSAILRYASVTFLQTDYAWYFQAGVAGQYLLGDMFQPSTFGVFLIVSLYCFSKEKLFAAFTFAALAGVMHATYLLGGAALIMGYLISLVLQKQWRYALALGFWALALVMPTVVYSFSTFVTQASSSMEEAKSILVHVRIPHHAIPRLWFDEIAQIQVAWIAIGILLSWNTRLFIPLVTALAIGTGLTLLQVWTDSDTLALLFPWRISVYLLPVATTVILARFLLLTSALWQAIPDRSLIIANCVIMALIAGAGVWIMVNGLGFQSGDEELPMLTFVRENAQSGQLYMVPAPIPELEKNVRGARASSFIPLSRRRGNRKLIPINLQQFRLYAGVPIVVDFKAIPYLDIEVIEWHRRLLLNKKLYELINNGDCGEWLRLARSLGVSHVVTPSQNPIDCAGVQPIYQDDYYHVYEIQP